MNVCILSTSFPAYKGHHQSPFIFKLAQGISNQKLNVDVICPYYKESKAKEESYGKVKVHRFQYLYPVSLQKLTSMGGLPHNLKKFRSKLEFFPYFLAFFLKALKYGKKADIIHAQWILSGFIAVLIKKIYNKKVVLSTRGIALEIASKNLFMRAILNFTLKNSDYITPNNIHHVKLLQNLGVPVSKIQSVHNGVDVKLYKPRNKLILRKQLGLNGKIIMYVGWFIQRKGIKYLIKAMPEILNKYKDVKLYMIGEGTEREKIKKFILKNKLNDRIILINPVKPEKLALYLSAADLFVLPSLSEGRPNVIYEAMLSEIPILATNIGGTNELVENNKSGVLVLAKNSKKLSKGIDLILSNYNKYQKIAKLARKNVLRSKISWDDNGKKFKKIYQEVLK